MIRGVDDGHECPSYGNCSFVIHDECVTKQSYGRRKGSIVGTTDIQRDGIEKGGLFLSQRQPLEG